MARAMVKLLFPYGKGGQNRQRCLYEAFFFGDDVADDIDGQPHVVEAFMEPDWNNRRLASAVIDAVQDKATALGLTVADEDISSAPQQTVQRLFSPSSFKNSRYQKDPGNVTTFTSVGMGAAPTVTGTQAVLLDTSGDYVRFTSGSVVNDQAGMSFASAGSSIDQKFRFAVVMKTPDTITTVRKWLGLFSGGGGSPMTSDTPALSLFAFRFSTSAGDANWQLCAANGSAQTTVDSGVAVQANTRYDLEIAINPLGQADYYINQLYIGTISTNLPASSTLLGIITRLLILAASARDIKISHLWLDYL